MAATADSSRVAVDSAPLSNVTWEGRAFGLEVRSNAGFESMAPTSARRLARSVSLEVSSPGTHKDAWQPRDARVLAAHSFRSGRPMMRVESDPELGFRIWAPGHGRHLVSPDGTRIRSIVDGRVDRRWERLLMAQPLPLAALLQGLELFHASAVELSGRTVAFVAESGTGKTSLAAHLISNGAGFVTDDVLALEVVDDRVTAHTGAALLNLFDTELQSVPAHARPRLGRPVRTSDKVQLSLPADAAPRELAAVFFLSRHQSYDTLRITDSSPAEPRRLLGSSFIVYLDTPSRLMSQLDFCAAFAPRVPAFDVHVPAEYGAGALAEQIERRVAEGL
jgi:hypothetical protein